MKGGGREEGELEHDSKSIGELTGTDWVFLRICCRTVAVARISRACKDTAFSQYKTETGLSVHDMSFCPSVRLCFVYAIWPIIHLIIRKYHRWYKEVETS